jgi:hypothetical protein
MSSKRKDTELRLKQEICRVDRAMNASGLCAFEGLYAPGNLAPFRLLNIVSRSQFLVLNDFVVFDFFNVLNVVGQDDCLFPIDFRFGF